MIKSRFLTLSVVLLLGCTYETAEDRNELIDPSDEGIATYNLDPENYIEKELGISELVNDDLEVICLETCLDCIVSYPNPTHVVVEDTFVLIGSVPPGMKPGELLLFSKGGQYRHKFGRGGRGPGEHVGWQPRKVRYYEQDRTVMVYWEGGHSTIQLFDINGDFKDQVDFPHTMLAKTVERWSDSTWFQTGSDDWGNFFGRRMPSDSIRYVLFHQNGEILQEVQRQNFPPLNNLQEASFARFSRPYKYGDTWKFNLKGNDTLFAITEGGVKADALLATPSTEFPLNIRVIRETTSHLILDVLSHTITGIRNVNGSNYTDADTERYLVLVDKPSRKTYELKLTDDIFSILDDFTMYDGKFMDKRFQWRNDRLSFTLSPLQWIQLTEDLDTNQLSPKVREKLKVLDEIKEDDNLIVFTFTLKDHINLE